MRHEYEVVFHEGNQVYAHHLILPVKSGWDVDHINGNKKDNRPENLQYLPRALNAIQRHDPDKGWGFHKATGKWRARIGDLHLGLYHTGNEAQAARRGAIIALFVEQGYEHGLEIEDE